MADRQGRARQWFWACRRFGGRHRRGPDWRLARAAPQLPFLERPHRHDHRRGDRGGDPSGCSALDRSERMGRRALAGEFMFKHILIPTDGSDLSRKAILYGVQLAKESGAKVTAITVTDPYR